MHGAIWTFRGEPEQLLDAYDGLVAEILPAVQLHLCLRTPDGIILVDTCPDREGVRAIRGKRRFPGAPRSPRPA